MTMYTQFEEDIDTGAEIITGVVLFVLISPFLPIFLLLWGIGWIARKTGRTQ